jgi:lipopolysaccharide export LptBFGC system permease protein LptF
VDLIEMIFGRGVPAGLVVRLLAAILPSFLEATLPLAFLLGVVGALGRMASDHETLALRAAGLSVWQSRRERRNRRSRHGR